MITKTLAPKKFADDATEDIGFLGSIPKLHSQIINDRFRILSELGRGGMAVVHLAEDLFSGKRVALKMMSNSLTGSAKRRFTREFSTIASLKHPYLIEVFEYGECSDGPFFAMELFSGKPATAMVGAPAQHLLEAIYKLCEAVDFVHSKRIIHRDIKPANIMVNPKPDGKGFDIRLSDFGLAKFANSSSSLSGDVNFLGTIAYCAPEQIMREELDHRADLYSLGMVVFELVTGRHPFDEFRKDAQALISKQLTKVPSSVREFNKNLSVELERAILKMLAKEQDARPNSTLELRQALASELGWSGSEVSSPNILSSGNLIAPFIAREDELRSLETFISNNCGASAIRDPSHPSKVRTPTIMFVAGEAGIGKTSLIKRAARAAFAGGAKIYDGRCFDGNLAPFQPFLEIVKQILSEQEKCRRRAANSKEDDILASTTFIQAGGSTASMSTVDSVIEEHAIDLLRCGADLKTLLANKLPPEFLEVPRDTEYVFRSLGNFFVELSKIHPMLIVIDDIHWADKSSIILLRHIASSAIIARQDAEIRGGPPPQLVIFGSTRNTTEYIKTVDFIDELCESELASKLVLEPLSTNDGQQLIASQLGARFDEIAPSLSSRLGSDCLGNPFYICQTIREWKLSERVIFDGKQWTLSTVKSQDGESLPESVREALRSRLRRLPDGTSKTLAIAAAIGSNVDVDLLQSLVSPENDFDFFDAIDDLLAREILRETGRPRVLAFAHDLLREASLSNLSATRRQGIHQAIGEALEKRKEAGKNVTDAILAEHFLAAHDNDKAFMYLLKAGQAATATYSHVDAILLLERAKQFDAPIRSSSDRYALCEALGQSYSAQDRLDESLKEFQSAIDVASDDFDLAKAYFGIGKCYQRIAESAKARTHFEKALGLVGKRQPKTRMGYLLGINLSGTEFQFMPRWLRRGKRSSIDEKRNALASEIYCANCMVLVQLDLFAYIYGSIRHALLAKYSDAPDAVALAYSKYGMNMSLSGVIGQFLGNRYMREARGRLDHCKSTFVRTLSKQNIAAALYYAGDLDAAERYFADTQPELDKTKDWHAGFNLHMLRHVASQRGNAADIEALARRELEFGEKIKDPILQAWGKYGLSDALSRRGNFQQAITHARESCVTLQKSLTRSVSSQELGRALIQASKYGEAEDILRIGLKWLQTDLFYFDYSMQCYSLYPESIIGSEWSLGPTVVSKDKRKRGNSASMRARFWAMSFPNMRAHTYRVSGRVATACGKTRRAIKYFDRALVYAKKFRNRGEYARTLIDKSLLIDGPDALKMREEGLQLLSELHTVLPEAEVAMLASKELQKV